MNIDKEKLFGDFVNIKNIANFNILKCYKTLFSKNGIKRSIGFFIIIPIIIFHFICIILFYFNNLNVIKDKIRDIIFGITNWKLVVEDERAKKLKMKKKKEKLRKIAQKKDNQIINNLNKKFHNKNKLKLGDKHLHKTPGPAHNLITNYYYLNIAKNEKNSNPPKKIIRNIKKNVMNSYINTFNSNNFEVMNKCISFNSKNDLPQIKESIILKAKKIMAYNDEELNQLSYKLALKYDKRTYCEYYVSLIKTKHNLIFSFFYSGDYNSRIMKIDLFFIDIVINFFVNALFFDDDTMHQIYEDKGKFQIIYQLPQIIYSSIISSILNAILQMLALSEDYILNLKQNRMIHNLFQRKIELFKKLKIIFLSFFIISSIFLLFFWYYISMFCAIYNNTQIHLIKDTLISLGLSLIYPFGIYLLPGLLRIPSLSNKHSNRICLYYISQLIQKI